MAEVLGAPAPLTKLKSGELRAWVRSHKEVTHDKPLHLDTLNQIM